ncbi:MAG: S9 family peptidase [Rhizobiaceae bacterium]|nr:S9 family peptidase [Rhizobiaceae bacterium]
MLGLGGSVSAADDPFIWLEERYGDRAIAWVNEQNTKTVDTFTADPRFESYFRTALDIFTAEDNIAYGYADGDLVYNFWQDAKNPLGIWRRTSVASYKTDAPEWETLLDVDRLGAAEGVKWVFYGAECNDAETQRCLISLSPDGGDAATVREWDMATRSFVADGFASPVSKSSMSWVGDDAVIVSSAYVEAEQTVSGYSRVVRIVKRGATYATSPVLYEGRRDDLAIRGYELDGGADRYVMVSREIDFYTSELYLVGSDGTLIAAPMPTDAMMWILFKGQMVFSPRTPWTAPDGTLTRPGGLYAFDFRAWAADGTEPTFTTVREPVERVALSGLSATKDRLFVTLLDNVRGRVVALETGEGGWTSTPVVLPDNGDVYINHTDYHGSTVSFSFQDFLTPPSILWSDDEGRTLETVKSLKPRFDASPYVSEQFEAVSADGTKVPYFVVRRKDQSAPVPALIYGYGGFETSMTPWYSSLRGKLWLEQGNVSVLANIRGGGEFGAEWHQAALQENRQRAYDDMAAIAEDLITRGITTAKQLAVQGGSNGGLLAGVMLTQRPDLFGAVISDVPLLDMLRYTELPPGASWIAEYGDPAIPEQAEFLAKYSPYQNVKADVDYPPALFTTSTADDRVHPGHARKMAALMQSLGHEAWFSENTEGGHGGNGDQGPQAFSYALQFIFLQRALEGEENHPATAERSIDIPHLGIETASPEGAVDRFRSRGDRRADLGRNQKGRLRPPGLQQYWQ